MDLNRIIYKTIKSNDGKLTFNDLYKKNKKISKYTLSTVLKELEDDKNILLFNEVYYELKNKPIVIGYSQWNVLGSCWYSKFDKSDIYGLTYDVNPVISIINKKESPSVQKIEGKMINTQLGDYFYVTNSEYLKKTYVIANYYNGNWYSIVNNSLKIQSDLKANNGDISVFLYDKKVSHKKSLGNIKDKGIETLILKTLTMLKTAPDFSIDRNVDNEFLDIPFYTIDNSTTKDIDDAIYMRKNDNSYTLYVAISDVSAYIDKNSVLDIHSAKECTSYYLPHETIHMLPNNISESYCSLLCGKKRSAVICEIEYDLDFVQLSYSFYIKDIISNYRLSYVDVNRMLNNQSPVESYVYDGESKKLDSIPNDLIESLLLLKEFTEVKKIETVPNSLSYNNIDFVLSDDGKIDSLYMKDVDDIAQKMVEISMIAANKIAAKFIYDKYPKLGIFRNQSEPIDIKNPKSAFYDFANSGHWGLNIEYYTHFTSPIRRYCDLIVHRLIKSIMYDDRTYTSKQLMDISNRINKQHLKSKQIKYKCYNILESQHVENLINTDTFDVNFKLIDVLERGITIQNSQLIEIYIPNFKLSRDFLKSENKQNWNIICETKSYVWYKEFRSLTFNFIEIA